MFKSLVAAAAIIAAPLAMAAQMAPQMAAPMQSQAPPTGFNGALVKYTDDSVTLKDKEGKDVTVPMSKGWTVSKTRTLTATEVKNGDFVASRNTIVNDSTGKSTELRVFEPGYRPEEGTHIMQGSTDTTMTHGTVTRAAKSAAGLELDVAYPGGARHLIVAPEIKITGYDLLDRSKVLKPGTMVGAVARKDEKGVLRAGRLTLSE
jgi:hypothetical protein